MRVLVMFECSGKVRQAFRAKGHEAYSLDTRPAMDGETTHHFQKDANDVLHGGPLGWDLIIAFPPCTRLCSSGARWWSQFPEEQQQALELVRKLMAMDCPRIAIENPVGKISTAIRKPDQYIQPWQFGHGETKKTGLWLKGLPKLTPTNIVEGRDNRIHRLPPSADRGMLRSITYDGIADAMASQWG